MLPQARDTETERAFGAGLMSSELVEKRNEIFATRGIVGCLTRCEPTERGDLLVQPPQLLLPHQDLYGLCHIGRQIRTER